MEKNDLSEPVFDFGIPHKTCSFSIIGIGGGAGRIVEKIREFGIRKRLKKLWE